MTRWIRFEQGGKTGFGTLEGDTIAVHDGDLFAGAKPTGDRSGEYAMNDIVLPAGSAT